jgi:hypothetical protein
VPNARSVAARSNDEPALDTRTRGKVVGEAVGRFLIMKLGLSERVCVQTGGQSTYVSTNVSIKPWHNVAHNGQMLGKIYAIASLPSRLGELTKDPAHPVAPSATEGCKFGIANFKATTPLQSQVIVGLFRSSARCGTKRPLLTAHSAQQRSNPIQPGGLYRARSAFAPSGTQVRLRRKPPACYACGHLIPPEVTK